jgi:type II secretory ATPase GspE/PulE/Tfp pilus assembly ATPase PilB-like protein
MAIRVFDKCGSLPKLRELGFQTEEYQLLYDLIHHPQGLMLITGLTGAGKTTSLYAILNHINRPEVNIITVEDPIEHEIPRANQIGVQPRLDVGFLECLRAAFRQDPDVLMIGEIRDAESARIAVLGGHLVFSTLHTGTAADAVAALVNFGIEPFLLSTALVGVMAQQLLRCICDDCRTQVPLEVTPEELDPIYRAEMLRVLKPGQPFSFSYGEGCDQCFRSGYRGRTGLFEILRISARVRAEIMRKSPAEKIEEVALAEGLVTMRSAGLRLVIQGKTTMEEVVRVVPVPDWEMEEAAVSL